MLLLVSDNNIATYIVKAVKTGTSSGSNSSSGSAIPVIAGSVGGAALFFIVLLLCVVILCVRQSHKKRSHALDNKMVTELSSDINMSTNPSYNITKQNRMQEDQYDYVLRDKLSPQDDTQDSIKMDANPSYGRVQGCNTAAYDAECDVTIQQNPSYGTNLNDSTKMFEDEGQDGYVETSTQRASYLELIEPTNNKGIIVIKLYMDHVIRI